MKLTKKLLLCTVAAVAAGGLGGCGTQSGDGSTTGNKKNTTMTVDATDITAESKTTDGGTVGTNYTSTAGKRYWSQLGSSEKVQAITTTITIDKSESTYSYTYDTTNNITRYAVVGYAFDMNEYKDDDGNKTYDFFLLGFRPETKKFYVERYTGISSKTTGVYTTNSLGDYYYLSDYSSSYSKTWEKATSDTLDWKDATENTHYTVNDDGDIVIPVTIAQDAAGTYVISLNGTEVAEYTYVADGESNSLSSYSYTNHKTVSSSDNHLQGGVTVYGFAPYGTKVVATYETDTSSVTGTFNIDDDTVAPVLY